MEPPPADLSTNFHQIPHSRSPAVSISRMALRTLSVIAAIFGAAQPARSEIIAAFSDSLQEQASGLATGDQLIVELGSGVIGFAGQQVELADFTGVLGYSSQAAYLVTIEGEVRAAGLDAGPGQMLLLRPLGGEPDVLNFDAGRLQTALADQPGIAGSNVLKALDPVVQRQARGIFLGRYGRTAFNVGTMGSAASEQSRRSQLGGTQVRALRFSGSGRPSAFEGEVVATMIDALARGDADAVAQLLDPLPFGERSLVEGADQPRLALARQLLEERDWSALAGSAPVALDDTRWRVGPPGNPVELRLRRTRDFVFVQSITGRN